MANRYYTGVGSREAPPYARVWATEFAFALARLNWVLRSGGAEGADTAFWCGSNNSELYLPWANFRNFHQSTDATKLFIPKSLGAELWLRAAFIAASIHPSWLMASDGARQFHTRNVFQVLGNDLNSPSELLICWAPPGSKGSVKGGTNTAWQIAGKFNIPRYNIFYESHRRELEDKWLS